MRHHTISAHDKSPIQKSGDTTVPVVAGVLIILSGILGAIWGCNYVVDPKFDKEATAVAMSIVGGFYMVLTGLWFATRTNANDRRVIGLIIMIAGIVIGTCGGLFFLDRDQDNQLTAPTVIFFAGLILHLIGVLYVRKE